MSRVVVISNRVMLPKEKKPEAAGGLAVALFDTLQETNGLWFGWSGAVTTDKNIKPLVKKDEGITYAIVDLTKKDYENYYNGYCNEVLWPIFHYRLDLVDYSKLKFESYKKVNKSFSLMIKKLLKSEDLIWVHDYHFLLIAKELRKLKCTQKIGFFLHIPWPSKEILTALPDHRELVDALLEFDLIGFQTRKHVLIFLDYIISELGGSVEPDGSIFALGKKSKVKHFPISIDTNKIIKISEETDNSTQVKRLVKSIKTDKLIVGVDRLDYSKGLELRFSAYNHLLTNHSEHIRSTTLLQIAPTSRGSVFQYKEIRRKLELSAGKINSAYGDFDWTPIRYLNKGFPQKSLMGFFRNSRIGLVTPLRDGMNLVAKEYIASQRVSDPGVLILSRFAGAAEEFPDALIVNPHDPEGVADALHHALKMSKKERLRRWLSAFDQLQSFNISVWRTHYIEALQTSIIT